MNDIKNIKEILRHIKNVQNNCELLGMSLMESGETEFGRILIANGLKHDNSKLFGIEWEHLHAGDTLLNEALKQHVATNSHHPEYWGGIQNMPDICIAEMVCDWAARSSEMGTSLKEYVVNKAQARFNFTSTDRVGILINKYISLLLTPIFV
jgi:hypothetical protein